jgi:hypothetical protein
MKLKLSFLFLLFSVVTFAQSKGTISGVITDKDANNATLPYANVLVKGTAVGVTTDENGKYSLSLAAGKHTLQFSFVGYESVEAIVDVKAGETIVLNKALGSGGYKLEDVVIKTVSKSREKESALLLDQKNSNEIKQSIGAQELSRKGVSDVATAVTKTTGITKQEGSGNIFVRGLGDRYNSTTMNGLPVPSNNPEKKNINLDIFSTNIVEYVSIDKVYSSKLYGDFAGGNVDIVSKDIKGKGYINFSFGSSTNSNATAEDAFGLQSGYSSFGFGNKSIPTNALTQYNFTSLQLENKSPIGASFSVTGGTSFNVGSAGKLSFFATLNHSNEYTSIKEGKVKSINGSGVINKSFDQFESLNFSTSSTGMVNVGYKINKANKINFNTVYINTSSLSRRDYIGYFVDGGENNDGFIRRNKYDKNTLLINQLLGEHTISERSKINWGVSSNTVKGDQPDRTQNTLNGNPTTGYLINSQSFANNHRYFQALTENELALNLAVDYKIGKNDVGEYKGKITAGYNGRMKKRDFEATQFNFKANSNFLNVVVDVNNLDAFYNQQNYTNGYFAIATFRGGSQTPNATKPQTYNGDLMINAGFLTGEYKFNKLSAVVGLRAESVIQKVQWNTSLDPVGGKDQLDKIAFLPSVTLKYEINEKQNVRFGASKTYTLPQFKERVLFVYEDVEESKIGNRDLYESDDYNVDLKWEMFPKSEEVISVTAFGKYIQNPINEVTIVSSTNDISFINTGDFGYAAGAEIEYRKLLFDFSEGNAKKLSAGINASYLYTDQDLSSSKVIKETNYNVSFTNSNSKLTGASDLLLNADLSYFSEWNEKKSNLNTTITYAYFSDRVYAIGTNGRGNQVDKAYGSLDFVAKSKLTQNLGLSFVVKNLLDPTIDRVQENTAGDISVLSYKKGLSMGLSMNYQF